MTSPVMRIPRELDSGAMSDVHQIRRRLQFVKFFSLIILFALNAAFGGPLEERAQIGLRLFRTLLAADLDLEKKLNNQGQLQLALLYQDDRRQGEELASALQASGRGSEQGKIRNIPIVITLTDTGRFRELHTQPPAAIYLIQPLSDTMLAKVIRYGIDNQRIVFSPFEGHVEKGVLAGLTIEARVIPYINRMTLERSRIRLKSFLLDVAKIYGS